MTITEQTSAEGTPRTRPAAGRELFATLLLADYQDAAGAGAAEQAAVVGPAFELLSYKPVGDHKIRVRQIPAAAGRTPDAAATLIEILNDDMPFLVDSVVGEIQARDISVRQVLHPIFKTERTAEGDLLAVTAPGDRNWRSGQESFIQVHVAPLSEASAAQLVADLSEILGQVRRAVVDWQAMRDRVNQLVASYVVGGARPGHPVPAVELRESIELLRWLVDDHFTFLGMRELSLSGGPEQQTLAVVPQAELGVLRDSEIRVLRRGADAVHLTPELRRFYAQPVALIVSKANSVARVHRRAYLDYVGAKLFAADGTPAGELRIVGLFTSAAYTQSVRTIPLLRRKVEQVLQAFGFAPDSHNAKSLLNILETFPRDELFQIAPEQLVQWTQGILDLELRPRPRIFTRIDEFERFVSALAYIPRDRFSTDVRLRIGDYLAERFEGRVAAFTPYFTEGRLVRVHFIITRQSGVTPRIADAELEEAVRGIVQSWQDRLSGELLAGDGTGRAPALIDKYRTAFSAGYREMFSPARALQDIARIDQLTEAMPVAVDFYRAEGAPDSQVHVALYRLGDSIPLSDRVPAFENFGFRVIDERSYEITPAFAGGRHKAVRLHDMLLEASDGSAIALGEDDTRLEQCFLAFWRGEIENDGFNRLVKSVRVDWREAAVARAYGSYLRQIGVPFTGRTQSDALVKHPAITADLFEAFRVRFDPARPLDAEARRGELGRIRTRIEQALQGVPSADDDRILRHYLNLISSTLRTNFYDRDRVGRAPEAIAFKLASHEVMGMPAPRPFAEIWVYAPRVEGVHLRFAPIARGGLRWSDRAQDFRTEVLGLVKAQQVKNTVIVPAGAKGGFVPKRLAGKSGEERAKEGLAAYELFVSTMLDLTDNIVAGKVVPPAGMLRWDGDDPYLVVAADKGTASFSDAANAIAATHGFWLGDAFASGGSAGYDHKKMAITARGAWECVKRHFREMDIDIQRTPFRVVGVGDMSGDVFGNGMLLSPVTRLLAAFDHRDIFIDPEPDSARSLAERRRLAALPRSSWQDYDRKAISAGGGVFSRQEKAIELTPQIKAMIGSSAASLTPAELIQALLKLETDLLWFGGIGTFVRASAESDEEVGDHVTDALRVTAADIRAKVIGEGANLAITQRGRIELGRRGVRLNTDFIDNSAGVNSSDQEVNIKIAFGPALAERRLDIAERNRILVGMTDEVAEACLRNNYLQGLALSLGQSRGLEDLGFQHRLIRELEHASLLDRSIEFLPTDLEISSRFKSGESMTRPELALLLSYAKMSLSRRLLQSPVPDDPYFAGTLAAYFPATMRERFPDDLQRHRLRREIIATVLTNAVINRGGSTMVVRLEEETGFEGPEIVMAFAAVVEVFGLEALWDRIDALDCEVPGAVQLELYREVQDLVRRQTAWFLRRVPLGEGLGRVIEAYRPGVHRLHGDMAGILPAPRQQEIAMAAERYGGLGVPADLAREIAALDWLACTTDMAGAAASTGRPVEEVGRIHAEVGEHFRLGDLRAAAERLTLSDYFDRLAINRTLDSVSDAQRAITETIARAPEASSRHLSAWIERHAAAAGRAKASLDEIIDSGALTLARLTVAAAQMRDLVQV